MQFVLAVIALATTEATDHDALAAAQKQAKDATDALAATQAADQAAADANKLTDDEQARVQQALNLISAATPPAAPAVAQVVANVPGADAGQAADGSGPTGS